MTHSEYLQAAAAFFLAALWTLIAMPSIMRAAKRKNLVTHPRLFGRRKRKTITYVGGLAVAGAAVAGLILAGGAGAAGEAGIIFAGAATLLWFGFIDDRRTGRGVSPATRLAVEVGVGAAVWAAGIRVEAFGVEWVDGVLTIFFLVAAVNSFNLLDNMDGITGSTTLAIGASLLVLAVVGDQHLVAILAAALCGGSLGFLRFNLVRARVYLGNGGALFIGFLLGATALKLRLPLQPPLGLLALIAVFAVPATDTSVVIISRLMKGRKILRGGVDHISHRLVKVGLSPLQAVYAHAGGTFVGAAGVAFALASKKIEPLLLTIAIFAALGLGLIRVKIYEPQSSSARRRRVVLAGAALVVTVATSVGLAVGAYADLAEGLRAMNGARNAIAGTDLKSAAGYLDRAERNFSRAHDRLTSWAAFPGRLVPGLRGNVLVATALAESGTEMVGAGREAIAALDVLPITDNKVVFPRGTSSLETEPFLRALEPARRAQKRIERADRLVRESAGMVLLPAIRTARQEALETLEQARREAEIASGAAFLIPQVFGNEGKRNWLIGVENTAGLRGRGGLLETVGVVEADQGRLTVGDFINTSGLPPMQKELAPDEYRSHYQRLGGLDAWANLGMSPNFPSAARLLLANFHASNGPKASGLVAMDPVALSYLVGAIGPVEVEGVPEPLTENNIVEWSMQGSDHRTDSKENGRLGAASEAAWRKIATEDVDPGKLAEAVGRAFTERHMVVFSTDPKEQAIIEHMGIGGEVKAAPGDYLLVLAQNMDKNKMDHYLEREISYQVEIAPDGSILSTVEITVRNVLTQTASLGGARSYLSVFVPARAVLRSVEVAGSRSSNFDHRAELGKRVFSTYVEVPPGESQKVAFTYWVPDVLSGSRYRLMVQNQATIHPDDLRVHVEIPSNAGIGLRWGFDKGRSLEWAGPLTSEKKLSAEVLVPLPSRIAAEFAQILRKPVIAVN